MLHYNLSDVILLNSFRFSFPNLTEKPLCSRQHITKSFLCSALKMNNLLLFLSLFNTNKIKTEQDFLSFIFYIILHLYMLRGEIQKIESKVTKQCQAQYFAG